MRGKPSSAPLNTTLAHRTVRHRLCARSELRVLAEMPSSLATALSGRPLVSSNGGTSYVQSAISNEATSGFSRIWGLSLAEKPTATNVVVMATNKGIYKSTDNGANFARVTATGLVVNQLTGLAYNGSNLFAGDRIGNYFCSTNDGTSWTTKGAIVEAINDVLVVGSTLYLLTDGAGVLSMSATCP